MFKSRGEASTSLRGVLAPLSFNITLPEVPNRAVHRWRKGPVHRAFLGRFQSAADRFKRLACGLTVRQLIAEIRSRRSQLSNTAP
jgi:hypothetical protein